MEWVSHGSVIQVVCALMESEDDGSLASAWCFTANWIGRHSLAVCWLAADVSPHDCNLAWCQSLSHPPFAVTWLHISTHGLSLCLSVIVLSLPHKLADTNTYRCTRMYTQMQTDVVIFCNRDEWLGRLSCSSRSIPQKLRRVITKMKKELIAYSNIVGLFFIHSAILSNLCIFFFP